MIKNFESKVKNEEKQDEIDTNLGSYAEFFQLLVNQISIIYESAVTNKERRRRAENLKEVIYDVIMIIFNVKMTSSWRWMILYRWIERGPPLPLTFHTSSKPVSVFFLHSNFDAIHRCSSTVSVTYVCTAITLVLGPLEKLVNNEQNLPPKLMNQISLLHGNGLRLLHLVNNLLDTDKPDDIAPRWEISQRIRRNFREK